MGKQQRLEAVLNRALVFIAALATAAIAASAFASVLAVDGWQPLDVALLGIFALLTAWIAVPAWASLAGGLARLGGWRPAGFRRAEAEAELRRRTAVVMPVYNEDTGRVFGNLQAMIEDLERLGVARRFDFFVLSDTTDASVWLAEERAWADLRRRLGNRVQLFYRRRAVNRERKSGNLSDFVTRWGGGYDFMLVLDADSLMAAETMVEMVRRMAANPDAALIQVPPRSIGRRSLFARFQQFSGALVGRTAAQGQAFWQLGEGNYWGHNAILRVAAFAGSCGLPQLPGPRPFGGAILSHDFVEAALLRRAGWKVWMCPELGGSWEEPPPSLLDFAVRDRRWCQGNIQHAAVVPAEGLHLLSRVHLVMGILSYLAAPLWLLFLAGGLLLGFQQALATPEYFVPGDPFPVWPASVAADALRLFGLSLVLLFIPKIIAWIEAMLDGGLARRLGGRFHLTLSLLLECILATLLAPAMMLLHSRFVIEVLSGADSGWRPQQRAEGDFPLVAALRAHGSEVAIGLLLGVAARLLPGTLGWWYLPLAGGLVLTPLLSWATAKRSVGAWLGRRGLFLIPEEVEPPFVVVRAHELAAEEAPLPPRDPLGAVAGDRELWSLHRSILLAVGETAPDGDALDEARDKFARGAPLTGKEQALLLADLETVERLRAPAAGRALSVVSDSTAENPRSPALA
ncbi:membrane glycosyltransferase [Tistlia consotensis]|uniref:Glucans biosynthesis glucosyltransferase H n=1 Tax=Tistlia consotensis USBA 355 TaxID=560819 RepID=A0A1Y6BII2_9PROT|nr:glucans biosynthesis glucosyltransferase MdoH [Tistlia consotensis]SMF11994.1 membrane glycosyltransferase [Tistlia consotensis USBA 355]SNR51455.1 membrane glycosyltransferase [Tistlia consotensis]